MSALITPQPVRPPRTPAPVPVEAPPKKSRGWILILAAVILVIGGIAAYRALTRPAQPAPTAVGIRTAKAVVGPLNVTLRMSGTTSARRFANVTAPLLRGPEMRDSLVLMYVADSGSTVKKGDVLFRLYAQALQ